MLNLIDFVSAPSRLLTGSILTMAALGLLATTPSSVLSQEESQTYRACYVPRVGALYLLGFPGLPSECLSQEHQEIAWSEGGAVPAGTVGTDALVDGAVTAPKIAPGAVGSAALASEAVTAAALAPGSITSAAIADGSILTEDLAPDAIGGLTLPFEAVVESNDANAFGILMTGSRGAATFRIDNTENFNPTVYSTTNGTGPALFARSFGRGRAALFRNESFSNENPAVETFTAGSGPALVANHGGFSGDVAVFRSSNQPVARIDKSGVGYFNGGVQSSGADVAELFAVEGATGAYRPGDVLEISTTFDRTLTRSTTPYSRLVAGVVATKPGLVLTERGVDEDTEDLVQLGVVGVLPTRVTTENGPIARGDLLVSSSTPGHAMKGTDPARLPGALIGKALEAFDGEGTGVIRVLIGGR